MSKDSDVAPARDRDACLMHCFENCSTALRIRTRNCKGRTKRNVVFLHETEDFWSSAVTMLNRLNPSQDRSSHAFGRCSVGCDRNVRASSCFYSELEFFK